MSELRIKYQQQNPTYYFSVAGLCIRLIFHEIDPPHYRKVFIQSVLYNLTKLLVPASSPHYTIHFRYLSDPKTLIHVAKATYIKTNLRINKYESEIYYHVNFAQFNLILRDILKELLVRHDALLLHASASLIRDKAYIFCGPPGAGKSTIVRLLATTYKKLGDDTIIVKGEGNVLFVYQTPFFEKQKIVKYPHRYPLGGLFELHKSKRCFVEDLTQKQKLSLVIRQLIVNKKHSAQQMKKVFALVQNMQAGKKIYFSLNSNDLKKALEV